MHWLETHRYHLFGVSILLLLWLQAEWRSWRLRSEMENVYLKEVTIQVVDADSREPLPFTFRGPWKLEWQRWPKDFKVITWGVSEVRVQWMGVEPVEAGVSSKGYQEQLLQLGQQTEERVVVALRR